MSSSKYKKLTSAISLSLGMVLLLSQNAYAMEVAISGNGASSTSSININQSKNTDITQQSEVNIANNINVTADTGNNTATDNSGNTNIETGDANINLGVLNAGNISTAKAGCCEAGTNSATISGNASGTENVINVYQNTSASIDQSAKAYITNNANIKANTGGNRVYDNSGASTIDTGDIKVNARVNNSPVNYNKATIQYGQPGYDASIKSNGKGSVNGITIINKQDLDIKDKKTARVNNDIQIDAKTGGNIVKDNKGKVDIKTGDVFIDVFINNLANINEAEISCCKVVKPEKPDKPVQPENPGEKEKPGEDEKVPGEEKKPEVAGVIIAAPGPAVGGPEILGLSVTSGPEAESLFWFVGLIMIGYGAKNVGEVIYADRKEKIS